MYPKIAKASFEFGYAFLAQQIDQMHFFHKLRELLAPVIFIEGAFAHRLGKLVEHDHQRAARPEQICRLKPIVEVGLRVAAISDHDIDRALGIKKLV